MRYSTAVLANIGPGGRRGLLQIRNRPMIEYVLDAVPDDTEDILIFTQAESMDAYVEVAERFGARVEKSTPQSVDIRFQLDPILRTLSTDGCLLLSCDTPLINRGVTGFLRDIITRFSAAIPRPSIDRPEFVPAAYRVQSFIKAMDENPEMKMDELVKKVSNILYISAQSFRIFDEKLRFLERVQNQTDVRRVEKILQTMERL
jgi:molybdopterin-guanine dinucleotide biosynthesis protein A